MAEPQQIFDRRLLASRRARAADALPDTAFLLAETAEGIADRLDTVARRFPLGADIGAQEGSLSRALMAGGKVDGIVAVESSQALLPHLTSPRVVADEEALPFADASLDLAVSGLSLSWVNDLPGTLVQIRRALKPDGLFLAAVFGGNTLTELRAAFLDADAAESGGAGPRVSPFLDVRDAGGLLQRAGFALPVVDTDTLTVRYGDPVGLLRDLRNMGWTNALADRSRRPLRRATLMRAIDSYAERFSDPDGRVRATFEFVYLSGWAPHESQQTPLRPGSARMRLADALGTVERSAGDRPSRD